MELNLLNFALKDAFLAGLAALAFAFCLGVSHRYIFYCGLCAALGHSTQTICLFFDISLAVSTFIGAFLIGILGLCFSKYFLISRVIFVVPGILPMLPGTFFFNTFLSLFEKIEMRGVASPMLALEAFSDLLRGIVILSALAGGLALPYLVFKYHESEF